MSPRRIIHTLFVEPTILTRAYGLPPGYEVMHCYYFSDRDAYGFVIYHPDFPVVPECEQLPEVQVTWVDTVLQNLETDEKPLTTLG